MRAQIARAGTPGPRAIGVDEISIRKRYTYRIVLSDLDRKRPIWFGGDDRSEASMVQFYDWLGPEKSALGRAGPASRMKLMPIGPQRSLVEDRLAEGAPWWLAVGFALRDDSEHGAWFIVPRMRAGARAGALG